MIETGFNKSLVVPMIGGESGFQVPKAAPESDLEETKNDLIRIAKDRKPDDNGIQPNQKAGVEGRPRMTRADDSTPRRDIIVPAY